MKHVQVLTRYVLVFIAVSASVFSFSVQAGDMSSANPVCTGDSRFEVRKLDSTMTDELCSSYAGKTLLVVNTASRCVYTDQYEGLQKLYEKYKDQGLVIIGFPSNDFNFQEPGSESSIKNFCQLTYNVNFPMYAKTTVVGDNVSPFYEALYQTSGQRPRWNFHKYLIDKNGNMVESIPSHVEPADQKLISAIEAVL